MKPESYQPDTQSESSIYSLPRRVQERLMELLVCQRRESKQVLLIDISQSQQDHPKPYTNLQSLQRGVVDVMHLKAYGHNKDIETAIHKEQHGQSQLSCEDVIGNPNSFVENAHSKGRLFAPYFGHGTCALDQPNNFVLVDIGVSNDEFISDRDPEKPVDALLVNNTLLAILDSCNLAPTFDLKHFPTNKLSKSLPINLLDVSQALTITTRTTKLSLTTPNKELPLNGDQGNFDRKVQDILREICGTTETVPPSLHIDGATLVHSLPVSCGGFSDVYQGLWDGQLVALKRLRVPQKGQERQKIHQAIINEALSWRRLSHPYLVPFLGIETTIFSPFICLVSPWMQLGTLIDLVSKQNTSKVYFNKYLFEAAQGLEYLHSEGIVHGGICGRNVLVNDQGHACLSDSGLYGYGYADPALASFVSNHQDSPRWMAPELLDPEQFGLTFQQTFATDVYAFGYLCVEVYTGKPPFQDITNDFMVMLRVLDGIRPKRPPGMTGTALSDAMWLLVERCWAQQPAQRPKSSAVAETLENLE